MSYDVLIRKNSTGEVRRCRQGCDWAPHHHFWWTDGNMGCDCNRELEFDQAGAADPEDAGCGDGRFTAIKAVLPDGSEILLDAVS